MAEQERGFTLKDQRVFSGDGVEASKQKDIKSKKSTNFQKLNSQKLQSLPKIDFATFIFSLNSSALVHLGVVEDPISKKNMKNLPVAKQTIDIIGMLEEKTRGNLTSDEENLLKNILHDLRLMYVKGKEGIVNDKIYE